MSSIAQHLLSIEAVKVNVENPFTLASGKPSPVYVNCRDVTGNVATRTAVMAGFAEKAKAYEPDVIAGGETAGIPLAFGLAERLALPMIYIRKKPKGYGMNQLIEGGAELKNKRVLLVEDLMTDGGSKQHFLNTITQANGLPVAIMVIFSYGLVQKVQDVPCEALASWDDVLPIAEKAGKITSEETAKIRDYLNNRKNT